MVWSFELIKYVGVFSYLEFFNYWGIFISRVYCILYFIVYLKIKLCRLYYIKYDIYIWENEEEGEEE